MRDPAQPGLDIRLQPLAAHVLAGKYYECAWELFRIGHLQGLEHEEAVVELGAWARGQGIAVNFDVRRVGSAEVIYVILTGG